MTQNLTFHLAQLRHAYSLLKAERMMDQRQFADGLIAPAIEAIEQHLNEVRRSTMEDEAIQAEFEQLRLAASALYFAGKWSCHRPVDEIKLWEDLRDALGLEVGAATNARAHD